MLERIKQGDSGAFDALVAEAWGPLCAHLTSQLGSSDAAEDAAQEAFIRLWERRERWQGKSARALVFKIGRNIAIDLTRRRSVRLRHATSDGDLDPATRSLGTPPLTPDRALEANEVEARVARALAGLPTRRREVFELVRYADMTYQEAAEALELSPQTIANHMSLALRDLRAELLDLIESDQTSSDARGDTRSGTDSEARTNDG